MPKPNSTQSSKPLNPSGERRSNGGRAGIKEHEGKKYLRRIRAAGSNQTIEVDVYCVLKAFGVTCQATGHAIKKLLCAGTRGKGNRQADLVGAIAAINRAIDMEIEDEYENNAAPPFKKLNSLETKAGHRKRNPEARATFPGTLR